jgi:ATP-dependent exoDNAse (exonuclease V) alpha subunit
VTSHSSQGLTADRVLIHADTTPGTKDLLNNRMAYVAVSRGA